MRAILKLGLPVLAALSFLGGSAFGQYYGETVTQRNFEESELFFQSSFLNTFGLRQFRDIAPGLIDEPFLNLEINPAHLPGLDNRRAYFYLDFRGDCTEEPEFMSVYPAYYERGGYYDYILPDYRWFQDKPREPQPFVGAGALVYPFANKKLLLGGTVQLINSDDPFYTAPYWIYYGRFGYDSFGNRAELSNDIPIIDRQSNTDEMMIDAQLYSAHLAYRISSRLCAGVSFNGVSYDKEGEYFYSSRSPYGTQDYWQYFSLNERQRRQDYSHSDFSGGLQFDIRENHAVGVKAGQLSGDADQLYVSTDSSFYGTTDTNPYNYSNTSYYRSLTRQSWQQDGTTNYVRLNYRGSVSPKAVMKLNYRLAKSDIDLTNASAISDTGFYEYQSVWDDTTEYYGLSRSNFYDQRSGTGTIENTLHQGMLSFDWQVTPRNTIITGVMYSHSRRSTATSEPVITRRYAEGLNYSTYYDPDTSRYHSRQFEDKTLLWDYEVTRSRLQIPVLSHFQLNEHWAILVGVTRIIDRWEITDETLAMFNERTTLENGQTRTERHFGERYRQPRQRRTEESTDVIANIEAAISPQFRVNLLVNPEFKDEFRIAQWWLSFKTTL